MAKKKNKKEEEQQQEVVEEEEYEEYYVDVFSLETNGAISSEFIKSMELPKFHLKTPTRPASQTSVEEHSALLITFYGHPAVYKQICEACQQQFEEFKIHILDEKKKKKLSTWELEGAYIRAVDLGTLSAEPQAEMREVQCEISYLNIIIDGVKL